jgi:hypothetical protein
MPSAARRSSSARRTERSAFKSLPLPHRIKLLIAATSPLLEFFAVATDVFTEDDALAPDARQKSLGRLYRAWKDAMQVLDPSFDRKRDTRVKKINSTRQAN